MTEQTQKEVAEVAEVVPMNVFLKLQAPTIDLVVKATDGAGVEDQITVGFKRYESDESDKKLQEFRKLSNPNLKEVYETDAEGNATEKVDVEATNAKREKAYAEVTVNVQKFIAGEIAYMKDVVLYGEVDGKVKVAAAVSDTRKAKDYAQLWGDKDNALPWLLEMYFNSTPWSLAIVSGQSEALENSEYLSEMARAGN